MDYNKLADKLKTWAPYFKPWIESKDCDEVFRVLKDRSQSGGKNAPVAANLFKCFELTHISDVRCIVVGLCPEHVFVREKGKEVPLADGLCLSTGDSWKTRPLTPAQEALYQSFEKDFGNGFMPDMIKTSDFSYLAQQKVLLYNIALTTQKDRPGSDIVLWRTFNEFFFKEVVDKQLQNVVILFLGAEAKKSESLIDTTKNYCISIPHPAGVQYGQCYDNDNCWQRINNILVQNDTSYIKWFKEGKIEEIRRKMIFDQQKQGVDIGDLPWEKTPF